MVTKPRKDTLAAALRILKADTMAHFYATMAIWEEDHESPGPIVNEPQYRSARALHAAWWFIENVGQDDKARTEIFFRVSEMVREAQS